MSEKRLNRLKKDIAARIQAELDRKGMKRQDLADKMGKPKSHISAIMNEQGNMTLRIIAEIEQALSVNIIEVTEITSK